MKNVSNYFHASSYYYRYQDYTLNRFLLILSLRYLQTIELNGCLMFVVYTEICTASSQLHSPMANKTYNTDTVVQLIYQTT